MNGWPAPAAAEESVARWPIKHVGILIALGLVGLLVWFMQLLNFSFVHVEATINPVVRVQDGVVEVSGTTSLPDGAVLDYYFWHDRESVNDFRAIPGGDAVVRDGSFGFETDLADWPPGSARVITSFSIVWGSAQPADVVELFGAEGERLAGPQVYIDSVGDPKQILVSTPFELGN